MRLHRALSLLMVFFCCGSPPSLGAAEAEIAKIAYFGSAEIAEGAPVGWTLERYRGEPDLKMDRDETGAFLRLASRGDRAFGVRKEFSLDLAAYPFLNWRWRAHKLPAGGDVRRADRDDQAAQIYVIYKKAGLQMSLKPPALAYVWDNEAPRGLMVKSPQRLLGNARYLVVRDRTDVMGEWRSEKRNLIEDGRNAFPELPGDKFPRQVRGILLFINTHHTHDEAAADIGGLMFSRN